jgi:rubrerythrin
VAQLQGEKQAQRSMNAALEAEKVHAQLYGKAIESVAASKDTELADVYVCPVCGFTMEGDTPERCPICGCVHTRFQKF